MKTSSATPFLAAIAVLSIVIAVNTGITACNVCGCKCKKDEAVKDKNIKPVLKK